MRTTGGAASSTNRAQADAAIAFHRWRAACMRAAGQIPEALLERSWCLFEPFYLSGPVARVSRSLTLAAFCLPVGLLAYGFIDRDGASIESVFTRWGIYALVALYALLGVDALVRGIVWVFSVGLPRRAFRRQAARLKIELNAIGLALSPALLSELSDSEVRERAARWAMLEAEAGQAERMGESAAKVLRRGVAPHPAELELLLGALRSVTVGLYCLGLACLWWPLFRIGVPGWMRLPIPSFPSWPATAIEAFAAAWTFHWITGAGLRLWLGCEPSRISRLGHPLASLWRARHLRQLALEVVTDPSPSALARARGWLAPMDEPPPAGVLGRVRSWLFAEE